MDKTLDLYMCSAVDEEVADEVEVEVEEELEVK